METLTSREFAETIGALSIFRELRTVGDDEFETMVGRLRSRREATALADPADVASALAKLTKGCTPTTDGLEFRLTDASERLPTAADFAAGERALRKQDGAA